MTIAIEIDNLTKDYETGFWRKRQTRALDGLSLTVEGGQILVSSARTGPARHDLETADAFDISTGGTARILGRDINDVAMHARIGYCLRIHTSTIT